MQEGKVEKEDPRSETRTETHQSAAALNNITIVHGELK
jgi:hypothetical protein